MEITLEKKYDFIPEWSGNAEDENPIVFKCSYLTNADYDSCMTIGSEVKIDRIKIFKKSLDKIENMTVNGKAIYTPEDFLKLQGIGGLFTEVTTEMIGRNNKEPGKNFERPSS